MIFSKTSTDELGPCEKDKSPTSTEQSLSNPNQQLINLRTEQLLNNL